MLRRPILRLHWKLFFPFVGLLWLIIGITIVYFVSHEKQRQRDNLENRLLNVNNTVIDAYERGVDLQNTVSFIRLFTDNTTLAPLRITVYDKDANILADNPASTIHIFDDNGDADPALMKMLNNRKDRYVRDIVYDKDVTMICSKASADGRIVSFAALPYQGEVLAFLSIDPMVWVVVVLLAVITSLSAYLATRAVCRNVYALRDFAADIAADRIPDDVNPGNFSRDELGDVSKNLLSLYREKINAEQEKILHERRISMNISHELKTPVGIIKGYIDTMVSDPDMPDDVRTRFLARIQQNTDRLACLVNDVSTLMRLDETGDDLPGKALDFRQLVQRLAEDTTHGRIIGDMKFRYDIPDHCMVMAHESLLTNALWNLIINAYRYSDGTEMVLEYGGEKDGHRVFTFTDNGVGVSDSDLSHLFDLFYRVDAGRSRKKGGSGLGLPLVQRVFTAMGGSIRVENARPSGLRFTFTIPAADLGSSME